MKKVDRLAALSVLQSFRSVRGGGRSMEGEDRKTRTCTRPIAVSQIGPTRRKVTGGVWQRNSKPHVTLPKMLN